MRSFACLLPSTVSSTLAAAAQSTARLVTLLRPWAGSIVAGICLVVLAPLYASGWAGLLGLEPEPAWSLLPDLHYVIDAWLAILCVTHLSGLAGLVLAAKPSPVADARDRPVCLRVTHGERVLLLAAPAVRSDWRVRLDLPGGAAAQDLFGHYLLVQRQGFPLPYQATDWVCGTYEKFGHVVQDREPVQVCITAWK